MTTAICPSCSCIWKPTTAEKLAAKSEAPPCFVCSWLRTEEGRLAAGEMGRRLKVTKSESAAVSGDLSQHTPAVRDAADAPSGLVSQSGPGVSPDSKRVTA